MSELESPFDPDLTGLDHDDWIARLAEVSARHGQYVDLGTRHHVSYIDAGARLLVAFEPIPAIRKGHADEEPIGWSFVAEHGWSCLTILSNGQTWFRDPGLYGFFDRLVDDGFFDEFDEVLFYGAHSGGYAAAAYSVAAPGARVLAIRPQATLDPRIAGWDDRYMRLRKVSFSDRYGYAPDMLEGAERAWIVFDPREDIDAMHAALFRAPNVIDLRMPRMGWNLERALEALGILDPVIEAAMDGTLDRLAFARLFRARQRHLPYLRGLLAELTDDDRELMQARLCRHALTQKSRPLFRKRLSELEAQGVVPKSDPVPEPA